MSDPLPRQATASDIDLVELRVGLAGLTAEVGRMRVDLSPLAALPTQLASVAELQTERHANLAREVAREVAQLQLAISAADDRRRTADAAVEAKLSEDIKALQDWQTWAIRLLVGLVLMAVVSLVVVSP